MNITFEEAAFGCEKNIKLDVVDVCSECNGHGGFDEKYVALVMALVWLQVNKEAFLEHF